jgi:S1-C subfamily serine protease
VQLNFYRISFVLIFFLSACATPARSLPPAGSGGNMQISNAPIPPLASARPGERAQISPPPRPSLSPSFPKDNVPDKINTPSKSNVGFGVLLGEGKYLIANYQLIAKAKEVKIKFFNFENTRARVVLRDQANNLSLLRIEALPSFEIPKVFFGESLKLRNAQKLFKIAYSGKNISGDGLKYFNGVVSSTSGARGEPNFFQVLFPQLEKYGGFPVFNLNREVVGLFTSLNGNSDNIVKTAFIKNMLSSIPDYQFAQGENDSDSIKGNYSMPDFIERTKKNIVLIEALN